MTLASSLHAVSFRVATSFFLFDWNGFLFAWDSIGWLIATLWQASPSTGSFPTKLHTSPLFVYCVCWWWRSQINRNNEDCICCRGVRFNVLHETTGNVGDVFSQTQHVDMGFIVFHCPSSFKPGTPSRYYLIAFPRSLQWSHQKRRHFVRLREECVVQEGVLRGEKRVSSVSCPVSKRGLRVFHVFLPKTRLPLSPRRWTATYMRRRFPNNQKGVGVIERKKGSERKKKHSPSELALWFFFWQVRDLCWKDNVDEGHPQRQSSCWCWKVSVRRSPAISWLSRSVRLRHCEVRHDPRRSTRRSLSSTNAELKRWKRRTSAGVSCRHVSFTKRWTQGCHWDKTPWETEKTTDPFIGRERQRGVLWNVDIVVKGATTKDLHQGVKWLDCLKQWFWKTKCFERRVEMLLSTRMGWETNTFITCVNSFKPFTRDFLQIPATINAIVNTSEHSGFSLTPLLIMTAWDVYCIGRINQFLDYASDELFPSSVELHVLALVGLIESHDHDREMRIDMWCLFVWTA